MHACSGAHHKLSFLRLYCGCGQQNPLIGRRKECSVFLFFELIDILGKSPRVSAGASLLSFSDGPLSSRMFAWRSAALVNRTRRICPKTFVPFRGIAAVSGGSTSCDTQPLYLRLLLLHFCHHPSSAFHLVVPQPTGAEMCTLCRICIPFRTFETDIREDANTHNAILCKYLSRIVCTAVDWSSQTDTCLWSSFYSMHFYLLVLVAQRVERFLVSVLHVHYRRAGNCIRLLSNTALLLSTDSKLFFALSIPLNPLRLVITAPVSILSLLASDFVIEVSDLCFFSPSSSIF